MDDSNSSNADPDYLPPNEELSPRQSVSDSPPGDFSRRGHRERSLTPFLRSQGKTDGHGLVFNSRISPSPNRSFHRRRRRHPSQLTESSFSATESESESHDHQTVSVEFQVPAKKISRRNLTSEMMAQKMHHGKVKSDLEKSGRDQVDRSEKSDRKRSTKHRVQEMDQSEHHSVTSKYSNSVSKHGERTHRVRKYETETVDRQVTIRTRDNVISRTSDYSSQSASDTEKDIFTSTPKNSLKVPGKVSTRRDSPRLQVFEGDDWIHSPRTGYTYANSLTYRDKVTPGRDVPMPHMTRLPLDGYEGLAHTELWEQSEIEVRNERLRALAEYSEDESSPPHRIYKRGPAEKETSKISNFFSKLVYFVFLPLTATYSFTKHLLRKIIYDIPAYTHKVDISLLMKSDQSKEKTKSNGILRSVSTRTTSFLYSLLCALYFIISLPVTAASATRKYLFVSQSEATKESEITPSKTKNDHSDLISEDEDESGLSEFVSAQKHIYSFREHLEDKAKNTDIEGYESILVKISHVIKYFTSWILFPIYLVSGLWDDFLDNISETSSEKSDVNDQELFEEEIKSVKPEKKSIVNRTIRYFRRIMFSLVNSIGPSVSGNYLITENIKSPKRVIFKDMPDMPETGAVSPIIVEEFYEEQSRGGPSDPNFQEDIANGKQYHIIPEKEELQLNSYYEEDIEESDEKLDPVKFDTVSESFSLTRILVYPFVLSKCLVKNISLLLIAMWGNIFYSEPELRRSRRLRGLNPEQKALEEQARQRRMKEHKSGSSFISDIEDRKDTNESEAEFENSLKIEQRKGKKVKRIKSEKKQSILEWFVSLFYRKKQVRRSRRLRGLAPEEIELREKIKRQKKMQNESKHENVLNVDDTPSLDDDDEESELIFFAYLKATYDYVCQLFTGRKHVPENDETEDTLEEKTQNSLSEGNVTRDKQYHIGLFGSIGIFLYSVFFKTQVRQSRRLRGLEPENGGYSFNNGSQRQNLRSNGDLVDENKGSYDTNGEEILEEYEEFRFYTLLKSISSYCSTILLGSGEVEEDETFKIDPSSIDVAVNEKHKNKKALKKIGLYQTVISYIYSLFFKRRVRQSRRLKGLRPENGGFVQTEQKRKLRSKGNFEEDLDKSVNVEDDGNDEEYDELIFYTWFKNLLSGLAWIIVGKKEADLSVQNLKKHNMSIESQSRQRNLNSNNESRYSVVTWLKDQYGSMTYEKEMHMNGREAATMADLSFEEEEALKAKANFELNGDDELSSKKSLTQKSKNIFSFLFLGFLPSWTTSWFWNSKSTRRSRRLIGKDPVEVDALNIWKTKTLEDDESINLKGAFKEEQDEEDGVKAGFPFCCSILLIPLILGLLLLACYLHPTVCQQPIQSLSQVPDATSHLLQAIKNTTVNAMDTAGDNGFLIVSYAKYVMQSSKDAVFSIFNYLLPDGGFVESLRGSLSGMWTHLSSFGQKGTEIMPSFIQNFDISSIPSNLQYGLTFLLTSTSDVLNRVFLYFVDGLRTVTSSVGVTASSGVASSLSVIGNKAWSTLEIIKTSLTGDAWDFTSNGFVSLGKQLGNSAQYLSEAAVSGISSVLGGAAYGLDNMAGGMKTAFGSISSNTVDALKSGSEWIGLSLYSMFSDLGSLDFLYPLKWMWFNTWAFIQSLYQYLFSFGATTGTSIYSYIVDGSGTFFTFLNNSSTSSLESVGQFGKDSAFYVASLPYTAVTGFAGFGAEAGSSLAAGLSYFVFQSGYLVTSAWERTNNYLRPKQQASTQEATINYELLIEKVLNSDKFLNAVSQIANTKVDTESVKFKEQLTTMMNAEKVAHEKESVIIEQYKSRIDGIKVEVSNEIKKMTEDFVKANLKTVEAKASEQDQHIMALKEKYQQMLLEAEVTRQGINTHTEAIEKSNQEMQQQIGDLKMQINNLEAEQKALNLTMTGCCKNITAIEITVEHYINDLLKNIMENKPGNEGKPEENFAAWVNTYFIAKTEIESKLTALTADIDTKIQHHVDTELRDVAKSEAQQTAQQIMDTVSNNIRVEYAQRLKEAQENNTEAPVGGLSKEEVFKIVKSALIQYDADKTGMFDYALETAGGSVVSTRCTETYIQKTAMYSIFGIPIWYPSNNPRTIIQPGVQPGECWAFKGSSGFVVIQLSERIVPTRFSMEHISKSMSPSGKIDSAPKEFVVYGLRFEKDTNPVKLGKYSYSQDQDPLQFYEVMYPSKEAYPYIELDIISNHGNLNYTCLYRFRVHGVQPST